MKRCHICKQRNKTNLQREASPMSLTHIFTPYSEVRINFQISLNYFCKIFSGTGFLDITDSFEQIYLHLQRKVTIALVHAKGH